MVVIGRTLRSLASRFGRFDFFCKRCGVWQQQYCSANLLEGQEAVNWYPGHMALAARKIREKIRRVDLVLEIRDARIPLSSANQELQEILSLKKRLVVLNKMDLANPNMIIKWGDHFRTVNQQHVFISAHNLKSVKKMMDLARAQLQVASEKEATLLVMVVGIPNVGKSCLINSVSKLTLQSFSVQEQLKKAKVGPLPGVTQHVSGFKIGEKPSTYVLDTPGVLVPKIQEIEIGMKLALTGAVKDTVVGEERLAQYLLSVLNARSAHLRWKSEYGNATDAPVSRSACAVREVLALACVKFDGDLEDKKEMESLVHSQMKIVRTLFHVPPELGDSGWERVSQHLLELYRKGHLGRFTLDLVPGTNPNLLKLNL